MSEACEISNRPGPPKVNATHEEMVALLKESKTVAIIGISKKSGRPSLDVGLYLKKHGYLVAPVNPTLDEWAGEKCYPRVTDVPFDIDIVDIFRRPEAIGELVDGIIAKKPKCAWFQLGIINNEAASRLENAGIIVVQDRCIKIEHHYMDMP